MGLVVAGIGASAGGLEALRTFVANLAPTGRIAYVVAQHLSPNHNSILTKLLAGECALPVIEAEDGLKLQPDVIHVTPPNVDVFMDEDETLMLRPTDHGRPPHPSIDHFFSSLSELKKTEAIGIILSGTGSDGTFGCECIKKFGGITLAQDDMSAKYNAMPHAAVTAGVIDTVCGPGEMFEALCQKMNIDRPSDTALPDIDEDIVQEIIALLADNMLIDVSQYKTGTIYRRLSMRVKQTKSSDARAYLAMLKQNKAELEKLRDALLIAVTSFFRDREVWQAFESQLSNYLTRQGALTSFRAWVPGCATGEEAYTLAIILLEMLGDSARSIVIQIFATDLDGSSIETARSGLYGEEAIANIPPCLIEKYFVRERDMYRVNNRLRELCIFARHDLVRSPPFMHIDVVTCRNLLIYFDDDLQKTAFKIFHAALRHNGLLMLGKAETATRGKDLFREVDRKHHVYAARDVAAGRPPFVFGRPVVQTAAQPSRKTAKQQKPSDILHKALAEHCAPPAALVDENFNLLATSGRIADFLKFATGETTMDLIALLPRETAPRIRALLHKATSSVTRCSTRFRNIELWQHGETLVDAIPLASAPGLPVRVMIVFHPVHAEDTAHGGDGHSSDPTGTDGGRHIDIAHVSELEKDLALTQEHLQTVVEELEISNEELQTMNEELQSANEELQASNEQLETSNEELQSSNEELVTVNDELERKSEDLSAALNEHEAILETVGAPMLLLDGRRALIRANSEAIAIMEGGSDNLKRYIDEVDFMLPMPDLSAMLMKAGSAGEAPYDMVMHPDGAHYLLRVKHIAKSSSGAAYLIAFQNQTELVAIQDELRRKQKMLRVSNQRLNAVINSLAAHIAVIDSDGTIIQVNERWRQFGELNGYAGGDFGIGRNYLNLCNEATGACSEEADEVARGLIDILGGKRTEFRLEYPCHSPYAKQWYECIACATPLGVETGAVIMHVDITERKLAELALQDALEQAEQAERTKTTFVATMSHELRTPLNAVIGYAEILRQSELTPEQGEKVDIIKRSGQALAALVEDILELSNNELTTDGAELNEIDLRNIISDIRDFFSSRAKARHNQIAVRISKDIPETLYGDMRRIRQVLLSLIGNALKFTEGGKVTVAAGFTPDIPQEACWIRLSVSDTGIGIPESDHERIFDPFVQLHSHMARDHGGAGLGLTISRKFITQMGGRISLDSRLGEGTRITVDLPLFEPHVLTGNSPALPLDWDVKQSKHTVRKPLQRQKKKA
ncbi:CheR family methyltransferase [Eilatimonas milleporae]|uniref:Two-component system CheB/CheR fusion protein n=1 Tax=Eilatimonas milleporae TaxID=911205 RepID=A0A3M0CQP6_9PROT|nr:CheR family methyltransferase [Eilatimonas milleporae]RMB11812.1 two-component system CheB/CheR fusion protein [Eilatimonas milleporae]